MMTTYRDTDLESLIVDLSMIDRMSQCDEERDNLLRELHLKISQKDLEKLYGLCESFMYNYERVF